MSVFDRLRRRRAVTASGSSMSGTVRVDWFQERVGKDWLSCVQCGCAYPPDQSCPYLGYHGDEPVLGMGGLRFDDSQGRPGRWVE